MPVNTTEYLNVLLIDDDEEDYFIISKIMNEIELYKCKVTWRYSYNTALAELQKKQYHIVFVDYRLGAKTGIELIEEAILRGINIPYILITGYSKPWTDIIFDKSGISGYLLKTKAAPASIESCISNAMALFESKAAR
jgi:DNA-binding NtrC family response regulator